MKILLTIIFLLFTASSSFAGFTYTTTYMGTNGWVPPGATYDWLVPGWHITACGELIRMVSSPYTNPTAANQTIYKYKIEVFDDQGFLLDEDYTIWMQPGWIVDQDNNSCDGGCSDEDYTAAVNACGGYLAHFDTQLCIGFCKRCDEVQPIELAKCEPKGVDIYNCSESYTPVPLTGLDELSGDFGFPLSLGEADSYVSSLGVALTCNEDSCDDFFASCISQCGGAENIATASCSEENGIPNINTPCSCMDSDTLPTDPGTTGGVPPDGATDLDDSTNLETIANNTDALGDLFSTELNDLNNSSLSLEQSSDESNFYLENIYNKLDETSDYEQTQQGIEDQEETDSINEIPGILQSLQDTLDSAVDGFYDDVTEQYNLQIAKDYQQEMVSDNPLVNSYGSSVISNILPSTSLPAEDVVFVVAGYDVTIPAVTLSTTQSFLYYVFSVLTLISCFYILVSAVNPNN